MPRPRRQPLLHESFEPRVRHGGEVRKGRRKLERPIDPKRPMHITFRSTKAKGRLSFHGRSHGPNGLSVDTLVRALAKRYRIRVYQYANSGNHLHLLARGSKRKDIQDFLRAVGSKVAQLVTGARKGKAFGKFWDALAFTRVVAWGRDFTEVRYYVLKNQLEAEGIIDHDRSHCRRRGATPVPFPPQWGE